jgi:hypothetical protein
MSRAASWALLLLVLLAIGCFAMDEIDKGMESYDKNRGATQDTVNSGRAARGEPPVPTPGQPPAAGEAPAASAADSPVGPTGAAWWAKARTLGSEPGNEEIAGCQLGGRLEFMLRDDCLARGGTPQ